MRLRNIGIVFVIALVMAGCSQGGKQGAALTVLATVNGEPVTLEQLNNRMKFLNLGFTNVSTHNAATEDASLEALSQLIEETLYMQEAKKKGIAVSGKEVAERLATLREDYPDGSFERTLQSGHLTEDDFKEDVTRKLTIEKLLAAEVYSNVKVADSELKKYFKDHRDEFNRPLQVRARQIVVEDETNATGILEKIRHGADFATIAKEQSLSPDGEAGGDLGYFSKGDMPPEFEDIVFKLKPGQISPVVKSPYGYHIFKVEDVRKAIHPKFDEVKDQVRQKIAATRGESDYMEWQAGLKGRSVIEVETEALDKL